MLRPSRHLVSLLAALVAGTMLQFACGGDAQTTEPADRTMTDGGASDGGSTGKESGADGGADGATEGGTDGGADGGTDGGTDGETDGETETTLAEALCDLMEGCEDLFELFSDGCLETFDYVAMYVIDEAATRTCLETVADCNFDSFADCFAIDDTTTACKTGQSNPPTLLTACSPSGKCKEIDCNAKCMEMGKAGGACAAGEGDGDDQCDCTSP